MCVLLSVQVGVDRAERMPLAGLGAEGVCVGGGGGRYEGGGG